MIIDISELNKEKVLQALYDTDLEPFEEGLALSKSEASQILKQSKNEYGGHYIDDINGIVIKWESHLRNGRYLIYTASFDYRRGNYMMLNAICSAFSFHEFSIVRKGYGQFGSKPEQESKYSEEREAKFKFLLKAAKKEQHEYGVRWHLQENMKVL